MDEYNTYREFFSNSDNVYQLDWYRRQKFLRHLENGGNEKSSLKLVQGKSESGKILRFKKPRRQSDRNPDEVLN